MVGVKIPRVGVKITRGSLTPGGQAAQGVKINCYRAPNCMYRSPKTLPNDVPINIVMKIKQEGFFAQCYGENI